MDKENKKVALLIDSDNVSVKYIDTIISELNQYGNIVIRRIYGDWSNPTIKKWLDSTSQYALTPVMQESNTVGKNATDIGLVIDAMKLLYEKKADVFCIVSSDGDFTKLIKEIRENGYMVIGMGEQKTPKAFVNACEKFVVLDMIGDIESDDDIEESSVTDKAIIEKTIIEMIIENEAKEKKTGLGAVGSTITKKYPEFDVRNYGYSNWTKFISSMDGVQAYMEGSTTYVVLNESYSNVSNEDIQKVIVKILVQNKNQINMGRLKQLLRDDFKNLDTIVKNNGYSKFSKYLSNCINGIELEKDNVRLI